MTKFEGVGIIMTWVKVFIKVGCIKVGKYVCCNFFLNCMYSISKGMRKMYAFQGTLVVSLTPANEEILKLHSPELSCSL